MLICINWKPAGQRCRRILITIDPLQIWFPLVSDHWTMLHTLACNTLASLRQLQCCTSMRHYTFGTSLARLSWDFIGKALHIWDLIGLMIHEALPWGVTSLARLSIKLSLGWNWCMNICPTSAYKERISTARKISYDFCVAKSNSLQELLLFNGHTHMHKPCNHYGQGGVLAAAACFSMLPLGLSFFLVAWFGDTYFHDLWKGHFWQEEKHNWKPVMIFAVQIMQINEYFCSKN